MAKARIIQGTGLWILSSLSPIAMNLNVEVSVNKLSSLYPIAAILAMAMLIAACTTPAPQQPPPATLPTSTPITESATPTPEPTPQATVGWELVFSGEEGPAPRFDHVLVYDPQEDLLVLFGGRGDEIFGDTWIYEIAGGQWVEVITPGPLPRFGMAAAYDPQSHRVLIFGGQAGGDFFNDVWSFDLASETWSQLTTSGGPPPARYGTSAIVDEARNRLIISHGFTNTGRFDDAWALDLAALTWTDISPTGTRPLKRCLHEAVYDAIGDRMLLFGGCSSGFGPCPQGDLWAFDLATHTWTELTLAEGPLAVSNPGLVFLPQHNQALLFGGNSQDGPIADLWILETAPLDWSPLDLIGPTARRSHDLTLDQHGVLWLFGGKGEETYNDLWRLTLPD